MAGRYKAYLEYKHSGVEWLGEIPSGWEALPIKYLVETPVTDGPHETPKFVDDGVPFVSAEAVSTGIIDFLRIRAHISHEDNERYSRKYAPQYGDIFLVKSGATTGVSAMVETDQVFNIWSPLAAIRSKQSVSPRYVLHYIRSAQFQEAIRLNWSFGTQQNIGMKVIENLRVSLPPLPEQTQIAKFLDFETAKIDRLIERQERLIGLLEEKRQAVISHAVTKGLNPDAPLRPSGVDWLGDVPKHWEVKRLKQVAQVRSGIPKGQDLSGKPHISVPMLRVANVQDGFLDLRDVHTIQIEPSQLERFSLRTGDVLMNEGGDNDKLGRGAVWNGQIERCIHQNHVFAIRTDFEDSEWLNLITQTAYAKFHFFRVSKQSTNLASISSSNIKETPIVFPPAQERKAIFAFVSRKNTTFEALKQNAQSAIYLLKERRTALISAAVTGKIDVREWVPPKDTFQPKEESASLTQASA
ncbi:restriction modification system DNA specificity domain-containing protein [Pseudovibrio japonicus]|uniref:Restriction modification system DNA specificity domain-containing protein n=1 Tax=Pseudovibrio japonicus TaxID=366534 RepID=A0ABQ3ECA1_9HYPH|nr:restriction endonuclease subunit S [Pseudovibrio japonicus]GHB33270.1 restriction modification system DNA specificity domain-containing protein [Pseudovibrio japonicus]